MAKRTILGINVTNRIKQVSKLQAILTEYGCSIKTRLGLHDASSTTCSPSGLLILELIDNPKEVKAFMDKLAAVEGIEVKKMAFKA